MSIWGLKGRNMALSELALISLAGSLAVNPTSADIQKYQSLSPSDQVKVQELIDQTDKFPPEIEKIINQGPTSDGGPIINAPTTETMTM